MAKRLKTLEDVRRYIAKLVNKIETDEIDPAKAAKIGYLLNILLSCIKDGDIETRLKAIEDHFKNEKDRRKNL